MCRSPSKRSVYSADKGEENSSPCDPFADPGEKSARTQLNSDNVTPRDPIFLLVLTEQFQREHYPKGKLLKVGNEAK